MDTITYFVNWQLKRFTANLGKNKIAIQYDEDTTKWVVWFMEYDFPMHKTYHIQDAIKFVEENASYKY